MGRVQVCGQKYLFFLYESQHNSIDTNRNSLKFYLETNFPLYGFHISFCKRISQQHNKGDSRGNDYPNNQQEKHWKL